MNATMAPLPYNQGNATAPTNVTLENVGLMLTFIVFYFLSKLFLIYILSKADHVKPLRYKAALLAFINGTGVELLLHHGTAYLAKYAFLALMFFTGCTVLAIWFDEKKKRIEEIFAPRISPSTQSLPKFDILGKLEEEARRVDLDVFTVVDVHSSHSTLEEPVAGPSGLQSRKTSDVEMKVFKKKDPMPTIDED